MPKATAPQEERRRPFRIAIDGPAGAGKSTLASFLAQRLSFTHLNTGILYRALSRVLLDRAAESTAGSSSLERVKQMLEKGSEEASRIIEDFDPEIENNEVTVKGKNITEFLRTPEIDIAVGVVAKYPIIREKITGIQKQLAQKYSVPGIVIEGRDIGTVVVPDAELKIFLVASVDVRAQRRAQEQKEESLENIKREIRERDHLDTSRAHSPLIQAQDAVLLDNSHLTVEETVNRIQKIVAERRAEVKRNMPLVD